MPHEKLKIGRRKTYVLKSRSLSCKSLPMRNFVSSPQYLPVDHDACGYMLPKSGVDVTSCNRMIIDFSKDRDFVSARKLFDNMPKRDLVTWNSMMTAYFRNECCKEVLELFSALQRSQFKPNCTSFSMGLNSCGKIRALVHGRTIHGLAIKMQASSNLFVGTSLITMYSRCSVADCLSKVFECIHCPNTASWNALISGFVWNGQVSNAREVFDRMPIQNVVSWTAMISGYVEVKKMRIAIELFEAMPVKNHVSWCVILGGFVNCRQFDEALEFFSKMLGSGVRATVPSLKAVANACSFTGNLKQGCKIHGYIIKLGFHLDQMIEASLVSMYCHCLELKEAELEFRKLEMKYIGSWNAFLCGYVNNNNYNIYDARRFFDSIVSRDNLTWNLMINGYLKHNKLDDAMKLFSMMPEPTMEVFTALMYSFIKNGNLEVAVKLFYRMPERDVVAYTTLVFGYLENGQLEDAMELFNKMPVKNVVSYNVMISGLLRSGKTMEAYYLFKKSPVKDAVSWDSLVAGFVENGFCTEGIQLYKNMLLSDIRPSELIIASLLRASARLSIIMHGEQIHGMAVKLGHECCLIVGNSLINMYGKCGNILMAKFVFDQMAEHDVVAWNAIIHNYACNGFGKEAIVMFMEMKMSKIKPDDVTFLGILFACNHNCLWEEAQGYFNSMVHDYGIKPSLAHYACLIDLLCRMGMTEKAEELAHSMPFEPDSTVWTSILSGCKLHCNVKLAEHAANQLNLWDPLDRMPYMHLIRIYESIGRWSDVERIRSKMNELTSNTRAGCSWV
ncbi:hypothetical protein IEQ34_019316 [Dendrobium chrysotoxum]|uniref:Pentatricopeptide repeat-containing protein n=1 Tax=Dendrobium chrysotoxum TaxID=161865 RepID=A0AAV7G8G8_DENCH|nr:hypothetical protein IEQ34_019316 [Dendrobium chrysotoxum]